MKSRSVPIYYIIVVHKAQNKTLNYFCKQFSDLIQEKILRGGRSQI